MIIPIPIIGVNHETGTISLLLTVGWREAVNRDKTIVWIRLLATQQYKSGGNLEDTYNAVD